MSSSSDSDSIKILTAQCHCKAVHFTLRIPSTSLPLPVHLCHCSICRFTHGTPCTFHAPLPSGVQPEFIFPSCLSNLTSYVHALSQATKYFCNTCGCHIGDQGITDTDWVISSAIFDANINDPGVFELKTHVFTHSAPDGGLSEWVTHIGDRKMRVWNPETDEKPSPVTGKQIEEKLNVQCHCGGVSFWLSRPSRELLNNSEMRLWVSPVDETKWLASLDTCDDCRLVDGANVIAWMFIPKDHISPAVPDNLLIGTSKRYASSKDILRTFCGTCGATVFYYCEDRPHILDVAVGLLRAPEGVKAQNWLTWRTGRLGSPKDGMGYDSDFTKSLAQGLEDWGRATHGSALDFTIP